MVPVQNVARAMLLAAPEGEPINVDQHSDNEMYKMILGLELHLKFLIAYSAIRNCL